MCPPKKALRPPPKKEGIQKTTQEIRPKKRKQQAQKHAKKINLVVFFRPLSFFPFWTEQLFTGPFAKSFSCDALPMFL